MNSTWRISFALILALCLLGLSLAACDKATGGEAESAEAETPSREATAEKHGKLDTAGEKAAAKKVGDAIGAGGAIRFEDVDGIGDQARIEADAGTLRIRKANLYLTLEADYGPKIPAPEDTSMDAIKKAMKEWRAKTAPRRKKAAVNLGRRVAEAL